MLKIPNFQKDPAELITELAGGQNVRGMLLILMLDPTEEEMVDFPPVQNPEESDAVVIKQRLALEHSGQIKGFLDLLPKLQRDLMEAGRMLIAQEQKEERDALNGH